MDTATVSLQQLAVTFQRIMHQLLTIGGNRLELLMVEVQEERERFLHAILLAFAVASFGLLAAITLTATIVVLLWACSPVAVLLTLTGLYGVVALLLYRRLTSILREWKNLPATIDQLRKDGTCLEAILE